MPGAQWVSTRMYSSFGDMWLGWRKNLYLLWGCSPLGVLGAFARIWFLYVAPPIGCILGLGAGAVTAGADFAAFGLGFLAAVGAGRYFYSQALKRIGFAPEFANYLIPGAALFGLMLVDSMVAHRWLGSVSWKGRAYYTNRNP